jgi:glycosyltransferase involved in cell wall biosynthesis
MVVIANGFDTTRFYPDPGAGHRLRQKWGVAEDHYLIGLVARLDPIKCHPDFVRAAAMLARERDDVHFVCVGSGSPAYRDELQTLALNLGVGDRIIWTGELSGMREAYSALDIATSSSSSEGFSNTIGEAMACGVPCVVTDVGDSAILVGHTGFVVAPGKPAELAAAWRRLLEMPGADRAALSAAARDRITSEFSVEKLVLRTEAALTRVVSRPRRGERAGGAAEVAETSPPVEMRKGGSG